MELYGFQQQLAKLQLALERAGDAHAAAAAQRAEADGRLAALRAEVAAAEAAVAAEEARAEELQGQLDGLAATLLAVQRHNEAAAGELAAAKREAYASEGAVAAAEAAKAQQDFLIDGMQQQLRRLGRAAELQAEALEAQRREAAAAREYLAAALAGMEGVAFEKKQLLGQWRGVLRAMGQRDATLEVRGRCLPQLSVPACSSCHRLQQMPQPMCLQHPRSASTPTPPLQGLQETLRKQAEQQAAIATEQEGCRHQLGAERQRTEAAAAVEKNLGRQAQRLAAQIERVQARQAELKVEWGRGLRWAGMQGWHL